MYALDVIEVHLTSGNLLLEPNGKFDKRPIVAIKAKA